MRGKDTVKRNEFYHCLEYDYDQQGDLCLVACGMECCDAGVVYGPDLRRCWHLHIVQAGKGTLWAGGQVFHPHAGQLFLLKDNEIVRYAADRTDPWEYCWVTYNGALSHYYTRQMGFTDGIYCLDCSVSPSAFYDLIRRMHEKPEMSDIYDLRRRGILMEFLSLAMEGIPVPDGKAQEHKYSVEYYVKKAVDFIHYNYASMQISDLTEYIGFSRSYFSTMFRRYMGIAPQAYLNRYRMDQACRLLDQGSFSVGSIAAQVGFDDPLHFSRSFRQYMQMSPTEYRDRKKSQGE